VLSRAPELVFRGFDEGLDVAWWVLVPGDPVEEAVEGSASAAPW